MHEWALAESILVAAVEAAEKEKLKTITEIRIGIGELQQIEQDIFEFALEEIIRIRQLLNIFKKNNHRIVCFSLRIRGQSRE